MPSPRTHLPMWIILALFGPRHQRSMMPGKSLGNILMPREDDMDFC
jgi:hypothetical protein